MGGRVVLDETGLKGGYNWTLNWTPENLSSQPNRQDGRNTAGGGQPQPVSAPPPGVSGESLFTALEEQLGLKLVRQKAPGRGSCDRSRGAAFGELKKAGDKGSKRNRSWRMST